MCLYKVFTVKIQFVCDTHIKMHPTLQECGKSSNISYWYWKIMPEATVIQSQITRRWEEEKEAAG